MSVAVPSQAQAVSQLHLPGSFDTSAHPQPTRSDEVWRYTPVDKLLDLADTSKVRTPLSLGVESGPQLMSLGPEMSPRGQVLIPVDRPSAIAAAVDQAEFLLINGVHTETIRLNVSGEIESKLTANHLVIEAKPGSSAIVVITHFGKARYVGNIEILVGDNAELTVVSIQDWQPGSIHLGQHEALVSPDAKYRHVMVSIGGDLVRLTNNVSFASHGGQAELYGVYFTSAHQHLEHRLFIDHNYPKSVSKVDYRGGLQGEGAHSVWVGDVLIRPQALGIETMESNRNLVLTKGCRADAVPNLEIQTGEIVAAGHSASVGHFDDEQLFYLQSRAIPPDQARHLVAAGFFKTILSRIGIEDVESTIMARIDAELGVSKENWS